MARLSLPVHSYTLRSTPASPARLVNCYPEALPADAKTPLILSRAPGVASFSSIGNGPIRGMHGAFGYLFVVTGTDLYRFDSAAGVLSMGTIPGTGLVSMDHNIDTLVIVAEPDAYTCDPSTAGSVAQITDPDFTSRGAKYVKFVDNYLLFMEPNSGRFFGADVGSATSYDALDFATAEAAPDDLVGMTVDHRQVVLLGEESGEIWENTGAAGFPFERAINGFFELGCFNGDTVAKMDNSVIWVANDYTVRKLQGVTPQRISTHAVEQFLTTVDLDSGRAYSYSQDGHFFYVLSFNTGCWVYDATANEWHERATYPYDYYYWQTCAQAHGRQYVGSAFTDSIGYFDPETYTEAGGVQRAEWTYQPVYAENKRAFHDRLEVVMEVGVGLTTGQGSDPEMMMAYSDDGGQTWVNLPNKKIGPIGSYQQRVVWTGLGSARQRVYRGAISDPIKVVISDTVIEVRGGRI
jgi:hypothetical protein